ncbi:peptidoglycan DD-metalloendopeptidase family protein [Helicobacter sp. 11S02629-2]|uniref:murein hydrolase activator EnvC family protein n=1 Tax=Helicobacter sp. 11S02629-2 TaxID=1476195 RepID=UPI0021511FCE|nr:peptidoglycan DD-metalloendopeptidase family protein [Helicobacter sp. 11S02629-2]
MKPSRLILPLALLALMPSLLNATDISDINKNINQNKAKLNSVSKQKDSINSKLDSLGLRINQRLKQIKLLDKEILSLNQNIQDNRSQNQDKIDELSSLKARFQDMQVRVAKIQTELASIIMQDLIFSDILQSREFNTKEDVVIQETFKVLRKKSLGQIKDLKQQASTLDKQIASTQASIAKVSALINTQVTKQQNLTNMLKNQKTLIASMQNEVADYNSQLKDIDAKRQSLDDLLTKLNILKKNKQEELKREAERKRLAELERQRILKEQKEKERKLALEKARLAKLEAEKKALEAKAKQANGKDIDSINKNIARQNDKILTQNLIDSASQRDLNAPIDVKQIASSYQIAQTIRYKGPKTIAPLTNYTVEQNYGTYYDPVYKLKVFNEGVILKSKENDAMVRAVMDGKVIYAQEMPVLKKVVIIEHANSLHTIYSQLDKIAPTLRPGFIVKKGYVIGRVNKSLSFEVTQKDKHIDPMDLIK